MILARDRAPSLARMCDTCVCTVLRDKNSLAAISGFDSIDQAVTALDVRAALAQLTPEHRQVIIEMYYLGRPVAEIARTLRIPEGTVKSRAYYGLRHLKRLLSPVFGEMELDQQLASA
jgi:DNA-directed RNA polymerase specialized sigma24 family protein